MKTFIIAEAGVNHNGDLSRARQLVDAAVDACADAVKFQTFQAKKLVTSTAARAKYQSENTANAESQEKMLRQLELPENAEQELFAYCGKKGIQFLSTPFDEESADMLHATGMRVFKIPSGELTNKPLLQHVASYKKPIILSTGMSTLGEVEKAIHWIAERWGNFPVKENLTLLHCVSNYPAAFHDVNLLAMETMRRAFGLPVGYSDHTKGIEASVAAAALGASVIEKHFTLDKNLPGPDHKASLEPEELNHLVQAIRNVEKAMGDGVKQPTAAERETMVIARKSLVAARDMAAGDALTINDIVIKRPGTGIPPEFVDVVAGMRLSRDVSRDTVLLWEHIKIA